MRPAASEGARASGLRLGAFLRVGGSDAVHVQVYVNVNGNS
ncbi:MAG: hypothetical protein RL701_7608 [Pseudomonadota bacterium]